MQPAGSQSSDYELVVSSDNVQTLAWQCAVFDWSCRQHGAKRPLVVVHGDLDVPLQEHYKDLRVVRAPDCSGRFQYKVRNAPASLLVASEISPAEYLVLCDPDFVAINPLDLPALPGGVTSALYRCLKWGPAARRSATRWGLDPDEIAARSDLNVAVPHVVHRDVAEALAKRWMRVDDTYYADAEAERDEDVWRASMYAFGIAVVSLGIEHMAHNAVTMNDPRPLRDYEQIVHYVARVGDWFKRSWYPGKGEIPRPEDAESRKSVKVLEAIHGWAAEAGVTL